MVSHQKETLRNLWPPILFGLVHGFKTYLATQVNNMGFLLLLNRLEVHPHQERNIHTLILSVDSVEDQTSIYKRREMPKVVVVHTPKPEDITGPQKLWEERVKVPVEWDISNLLIEKRRTVTEPELKPPRRLSPSEHDQVLLREDFHILPLDGIE